MCSKMASEIVYRVMTEADIEPVKALLNESLFQTEPLSVSLGIEVPRECKVYVDTMAEYAGKCQDPVSILAETHQNDGTKLIVGCRLTTIDTPNDEFTVECSKTDPNDRKFDLIAKFLGYLHVGIDHYERFGVDRCMHFQAVNVRKEFGQRGIGKRLIEESIKLGREKGVRLFMAEVTGKFSQRIYETLKFEVLNEVKYDEYLDENGARIFGDTGIHTSGKLVVRLYDAGKGDINENTTVV